MSNWEDQLRRVPLTKADPASWKPGIRPLSIDEQDALGVDKDGKLYWHGRPIAQSIDLTRWQAIGAGVTVFAAVIAAVATAVQGWASACGMKWWTLGCGVN